MAPALARANRSRLEDAMNRAPIARASNRGQELVLDAERRLMNIMEEGSTSLCAIEESAPAGTVSFAKSVRSNARSIRTDDEIGAPERE